MVAITHSMRIFLLSIASVYREYMPHMMDGMRNMLRTKYGVKKRPDMPVTTLEDIWLAQMLASPAMFDPARLIQVPPFV